MAIKKISPEEAFEQLMRDDRPADYVPEELQDVEEGFGGRRGKVDDRPRWWRLIILGSLVLIGAGMLVGTAMFYWFVVHDSTPEQTVRLEGERVSGIVDESAVKELIEANLKSFLSAETVEERSKYVYLGERELPAMRIYYEERGMLDVPLWKVERIESVVTGNGEMWFVVYRDLKGEQQAVSFQKKGTDYLLHWSAMKAFGEMTWANFMVARPEEPVVMRCYVQHYEGIEPLLAPVGVHGYYVIEDRGGIFSGVALMQGDSHGFEVLKKLPKGNRHPVTLKLAYQAVPGNGGQKVLVISALVNLRWQKLDSDSQLQEWNKVELNQ